MSAWGPASSCFCPSPRAGELLPERCSTRAWRSPQFGLQGSMVRHALSVGTDCSVLKLCLSLSLASFSISVEVFILHCLRPLF